MKRFVLLLLSLLTSCSASQSVSAGSNPGIQNLNPGWTYVQAMAPGISCASTTCALTQFTPTVAGSVWIVITTNASNISPSSITLGGGTWVHCTACQGYTSGLFATDIYYNLGGTTGTSTIDVNYATAPSTPSFAEFIEISPPSGYTASYDTGGYNASATCTTTCTGATLTLSGNDAIIMPTDYLTNWNGWNFITGGTGYSWFADWTGDGLCLNCTARNCAVSISDYLTSWRMGGRRNCFQEHGRNVLDTRARVQLRQHNLSQRSSRIQLQPNMLYYDPLHHGREPALRGSLNRGTWRLHLFDLGRWNLGHSDRVPGTNNNPKHSQRELRLCSIGDGQHYIGFDHHGRKLLGYWTCGV